MATTDIYTDRDPLDVTGNPITGIVFDDNEQLYTVLTATRSREYKTLKAAEKGLVRMIGESGAARIKGRQS